MTEATGTLKSVLPRPALATLLASGAAGLSLGALKATFQDSVEFGQIIAGLVKYPVDNPFYMHQIKVFSLINQVSALLLQIFGSEKLVAVVVSALLGMVCIQAVSMVVYAGSRDPALALVGGLVVYFTNYLGYGVAYPISPPFGIVTTFGGLGLSFTVLTIALFGAELYGAAFFLLGLAPAVHASLGVWLYFVAGVSALLQFAWAKAMVRRYYRFFIAGALIAISCLLHQIYLMQDLPSVDPATKRQYFYSFLKYFDYHRRKFYWNQDTNMFQFFHEGVVFCLYSVVAGALATRLFWRRPALRYMSLLISISGVLSLVAAAVTHLPPEKVPPFLLTLMPGRYVNVNNFIFVPFLLGMLSTEQTLRHRGSGALFLFFLLTAAHQDVAWRLFSLAIVIVALGYLNLPSLLPQRDATGTDNRPGPARWIGPTAATGFFLMVYFVVHLQFMGYAKFRDYFFHSAQIYDFFFKNSFFERVATRTGMLVVSTDINVVPHFTRRPILANVGWSFDGFAMVPESGPALNNILRKVYGIDLLAPPPNAMFAGMLNPALYQKLWENRTVVEWQRIRREFGVTDVLVKADWRLALPAVLTDGSIALYEIPPPSP